MSSVSRQERRLAFGRVAELYERARPSYPSDLVSEVLTYAGACVGDGALEIGAGTGKATRMFAAAGLRIVALEPSATMAAIARERCPEVTLAECDFEHFETPDGALRLVFAAQAWHWTDPVTRYARARAALAPGGALAVFWNRPDWSSCVLRAKLNAVYASLGPHLAASGPMHPVVDIVEAHSPKWVEEIAAAPGLGEPHVSDRRWTQCYTAEQYELLLRTHSDHALLADSQRERLLAAVAETINAGGGELELQYITHLCMARAT